MKRTRNQVPEKNISLAPVKFEDALKAALETPPERKPKKLSQNRKAKTRRG
jgi:hypothetical protein